MSREYSSKLGAVNQSGVTAYSQPEDRVVPESRRRVNETVDSTLMDSFFQEKRDTKPTDISEKMYTLNNKRLQSKDPSELLLLGLKQQEELAQLHSNLFYPHIPLPLKTPDGQLYYARHSKLQIQYRKVQGSESPLFRVKQTYDRVSAAAVYEVIKNYK